MLCALSLCVSCEVSELFRVDGSGSGEGDTDFFLPAVRMHGKQLPCGLLLGRASHSREQC